MIKKFAYYKKTCELIDTLWNVNLLNNLASTISTGELIDTLWNVN